MPLQETTCDECGHTPPGEPSPYCPECGAEDPWTERPAYTFDNEDLPIVFSHEVYQDNYELWRSFCQQYFGTGDLTGSDIAGLPDDFPQLECCIVTLYWTITDSLTVEGPFLDRAAAVDAGCTEEEEQ